MLKSEFIWVDYAKVVGIFLVVFGHLLQIAFVGGSWSYEELHIIWDVIYLFHMPLFFILSGFLFQQSAQSMHKVIIALVIPYGIYQFAYLPITSLIYCLKTDLDLHLVIKLIAGIVMGDGYDTPYSLCNNLPCWFLISMIQLRILFMWVRITPITTAILIVGAVTFLYYQHKHLFDLYFCIDSTIMAVPYFLFGYWLRQQISNEPKFGGGILLIFGILCIFILLQLYRINGAAQMNGPSSGNSVILNYAAGIIGSVSVLLLARCFDRPRSIIKKIARNTLFILCYHWIVLFGIRQLLTKYPIWNVGGLWQWSVLAFALITVAILLSAIPISDWLKLNYPIVLGKTQSA